MKNKKTISLTAFAAILGLSVGIGYQAYQLDKTAIEKNSNVQTEISETREEGLDSAGENNFDIVQTASISNTDLNSHNVTTIDVSGIVEEAMPSVVAVNCITYVNNQVPYFYGFGTEENPTKQQQSCGTGIIIGKNEDYLLVLTNNHVIEDVDQVSVTFMDESEVEGEVLGADADADLAVIRIPISNLSNETLSGIKVATLGDSNTVKVGEAAIAIGNALGYGQSVTTGVISATNRDIALRDKTMTLIQTDAAINGGNSGGPLLNAKGEVIGVNTVKFSSTGVEGMGYAIPISLAKPIIEDILAGKYSVENIANAPYLGIYGVDVPEPYKNLYNMSSGVFVYQVVEGSPAAQYGLVAGCIITAADGQTIGGMEQLSEQITKHKAGEHITLTIQMPDQNQGRYIERTIDVVLGAIQA